MGMVGGAGCVVVEGPGSGFGWVDGGVIYKGYGLEGWGAER